MLLSQSGAEHTGISTYSSQDEEETLIIYYENIKIFSVEIIGFSGFLRLVRNDEKVARAREKSQVR